MQKKIIEVDKDAWEEIKRALGIENPEKELAKTYYNKASEIFENMQTYIMRDYRGLFFDPKNVDFDVAGSNALAGILAKCLGKYGIAEEIERALDDKVDSIRYSLTGNISYLLFKYALGEYEYVKNLYAKLSNQENDAWRRNLYENAKGGFGVYQLLFEISREAFGAENAQSDSISQYKKGNATGTRALYAMYEYLRGDSKNAFEIAEEIEKTGKKDANGLFLGDRTASQTFVNASVGLLFVLLSGKKIFEDKKIDLRR